MTPASWRGCVSGFSAFGGPVVGARVTLRRRQIIVATGDAALQEASLRPDRPVRGHRSYKQPATAVIRVARGGTAGVEAEPALVFAGR